MKARRLKPQTDAYVRLDLGRGVTLVLLWDEYVAGLKRGKAQQRYRRRIRRQEQQAARQEAQRLDWIEE